LWTEKENDYRMCLFVFVFYSQKGKKINFADIGKVHAAAFAGDDDT
jgi:hypothetical protein